MLRIEWREMGSGKDKRRWPREDREPPTSGLLYPAGRRKRFSAEEKASSLVIQVMNRSKKGLLLQAFLKFEIH
jgi:hypothetical protein